MNIRIATVALAAIAACALTTTHAYAQGASIARAYTGVTPKYNRPVSTTALSGVGTAVPYVTAPFSVSVTGLYNLLLTATLNNGVGNAAYDDTFLSIYSGTFSPASPLTNLLFVNDDFTGNGNSSGSTGLSLNTGVSYTLVASVFDNGTYTGTTTASIGTVARPNGAVVLVPEAGSLALILPALGVLGAVVVRRKHRVA